jgi:hypothetical protein
MLKITGVYFMAKYDVFISYSAKDGATSEALAKRLDADGIAVWLDQWRIKPGDNILSRIEHGLQHSYALMLLLSFHTVGSRWTELERTSRQFRDPTNQKRRFVPVLIDVCDLPPTLAPLKFIDYVSRSDEAYNDSIYSEVNTLKANPPLSEVSAIAEDASASVYLPMSSTLRSMSPAAIMRYISAGA